MGNDGRWDGFIYHTQEETNHLIQVESFLFRRFWIYSVGCLALTSMGWQVSLWSSESRQWFWRVEVCIFAALPRVTQLRKASDPWAWEAAKGRSVEFMVSWWWSLLLLVLRGSSGGGGGCSGGGDGCSGMLMFIVVIVILMIPSSFLNHNPVKSPGNQGCLDCLLKVLHPCSKSGPPNLQANGAWRATGWGCYYIPSWRYLSIDSQLQCLPLLNV